MAEYLPFEVSVFSNEEMKITSKRWKEFVFPTALSGVSPVYK